MHCTSDVLCDNAQAAGTIMLQEQAQGPSIALPSPADKMCFMYLLNDGNDQSAQTHSSSQHGTNRIFEHVKRLDLNGSAADQPHLNSLLVFCQAQLQPERATSWIQGLLSVVQAQHVLVLASMPVCQHTTCISS